MNRKLFWGLLGYAAIGAVFGVVIVGTVNFFASNAEGIHTQEGNPDAVYIENEACVVNTPANREYQEVLEDLFWCGEQHRHWLSSKE